MKPKINVRECWYAKEELLEDAIKKYWGEDYLDELLDKTNTGTVWEYLYNKGKDGAFYVGNFVKGRLPKVTKDYVLGMPRIINPKLQGPDEATPYIYEWGVFSKQIIRRWGTYLRRSNKSYYFEDPVNAVVANCIRLGDKVLEYCNFKEKELEMIDAGLKKLNDIHIFKCDIKGSFKGNAGSIDVSSKTRDETSKYKVYLNHPLVLKKTENGAKIINLYPANYKCACKDQGFEGTVKYEKISSKNFLCIHTLAAVQELKYGNRVKLIEKDGILYDSKNILSMYSSIEQPDLANKEPNPLFEEFNKLILYERYAHSSNEKKVKNIRRVDYEVLNTYFELILDPTIHILFLENMNDLGHRLLNTCFMFGYVTPGKIKEKGNFDPPKEPVYEVNPICNVDKKELTLPYATIDVIINDSEDTEKNILHVGFLKQGTKKS